MSSRGPEYQFYYMEGRPKNGKRRRISFRYDPRVFSKLQSIYAQTNSEPIKHAAFLAGQQTIPDMPPSRVLLGHNTQEEQPKPVFIREGHTLVCGIAYSSRKTTCIEGLLSRWPGNEQRSKKIVAFITKRGENTFSDYRKVDPFINRDPDPDFLSLVVESMLMVKRRPMISRKINLTMAELCQNAKSLKQVLKNAIRMEKKANERDDRLKRNICILLRDYLENTLPNPDQPSKEEQEPGFKFSKCLDFNGNNGVVINTSHLSEEVQTLAFGSVAYELLKHHQDSILVVSDGWKVFASYAHSLGRFLVESLIEQGPRNRNYVIIESGSIDDIPLHIRRQMSTILLGYQSSGEEAIDEIRALRDLAKYMRQSKVIKAAIEKPHLTRLDIQRLKIGQFYAFPSCVEDEDTWRLNKVVVMQKKQVRSNFSSLSHDSQ